MDAGSLLVCVTLLPMYICMQVAKAGALFPSLTFLVRLTLRALTGSLSFLFSSPLAPITNHYRRIYSLSRLSFAFSALAVTLSRFLRSNQCAKVAAAAD